MALSSLIIAEPRCACLLLLDTSGSMRGYAIDELNSGLQAFSEELKADALACKRVEVAMLTFGPVQVQCDFTSATQFSPADLQANGDTPIGEAIIHGLELLRARKNVYKAHGISYYRPWIFLITDGSPTDSWSNAARAIHDGERKKEFMLYADRRRRRGYGHAQGDFGQAATAAQGPGISSPVRVAVELARLGIEIQPWRASTARQIHRAVGLGHRKMTHDGWTWAAACRRGAAHERVDTACRMRSSVPWLVHRAKPIVIVVSDGAGSATFGGEGASLVCRALTLRVRAHFASTDMLPTDELLAQWLARRASWSMRRPRAAISSPAISRQRWYL